MEEMEEKVWWELPATEKENYLLFHKEAYKEDLRHAEETFLKFPRWSIISGYYAMHDLTKYFLALKFNIKISSPDIHSRTIVALEFFIKDAELKKKLLFMLKEAKEMFFDTERLKERILPLLLKQAKKERGKSQYYTEDYSKERKINSQRAAYFLDNFVKPYIKLLEGLL